MLKIGQYPRNADGTPMDLEVGVLTDNTGNSGARLVNAPIGPDSAPIDTKGLVLVDKDGAFVDLATFLSAATTRYPETYGAKGDGVTDDSVALQAWLDAGGDLFLPPHKSYYCAAKLIIRKSLRLSGASFGFDARMVGSATMPGSRIVFAAGVGGFDIQPQWTSTAWAVLTPTQEGAMHCVIENIGLFGGGGAAATGIYCRTVAHFRNVKVTNFSGKGFDVSASVNVSGVSESGNASLSTFEYCTAESNGSHGFHLRGTDANVIKVDSCNSNSNGGWGFLDEAGFANKYDNCHAAINASGAYKATSVIAGHTYTNCYIEGGTGENIDLSAPTVVVGGILAGQCGSAFNAHSNGPLPAIIDDTYSSLGALHINWGNFGVAGTALRASDLGVLAGDANYGLVVKGRGNTGDVTLYNQAGNPALYVNANTQNVTAIGSLTAAGLKTTTGIVTRADNNSIIASISGNPTNLYSIGSGGYQFFDGGNTSLIGMTVGATNYFNADNLTFRDVTTLVDMRVDINSTGLNIRTGKKLQYNGADVLSAGVLTAAASPAHTGDVTKPSGSLTTTIAPNVVTYAKFQQVAANSLVGNPTGSLANAQGITLAGGLAFSGTTLTAAGALTPTSVASTGGITSSGGGVGYATGAGGTQAQATSKATTVVLNKLCGEITLNAAALAASTTVSFTFTNSQIAAGDTLVLVHSATGTFGAYTLNAHGFGAGTCVIDVRNVSLASLSEAIVIRFAVVKAVTV